ncbi:MAG: hypothetical protein DSY90_00660, partial [Deltaproteobacteria bacterium]
TNKKKAVLLIRRLIGVAMTITRREKETLREKMLRLTGRDIRRCPYCGRGGDDAVWRDPCAEQFAGRMWPSL